MSKLFNIAKTVGKVGLNIVEDSMRREQQRREAIQKRKDFLERQNLSEEELKRKYRNTSSPEMRAAIIEIARERGYIKNDI